MNVMYPIATIRQNVIENLITLNCFSEKKSPFKYLSEMMSSKKIMILKHFKFLIKLKKTLN